MRLSRIAMIARSGAAADQMEDDEQGEQDEDCTREEGGKLPDAGAPIGPLRIIRPPVCSSIVFFQEGGVQAVAVHADVQIVDRI